MTCIEMDTSVYLFLWIALTFFLCYASFQAKMPTADVQQFPKAMKCQIITYHSPTLCL